MTSPTVSVTISKDGTIVIPKKLRKALNLSDGQSVILRQSGQTIVVAKPESESLRSRAEALVTRARAQAALEAANMTKDEAWEKFNQAAEALRKAARKKRASNRKKP